MKELIPENLKGKELFKFLIENKTSLISQKKSMLKRTDAIISNASLFNVKDKTAIKAAPNTVPADATTVRVKVVANTALWLDSAKDVLLPDCWKKSIKDRKGMIPHLHDHVHEIGAEVGDVVNIYSQDVSLTDLGVNKAGTAQALIFETDIQKSYNPVVFEKYRTGKIKQHSIGLQYGKIDLAINDEESEKEYDFWTKYYDQLINPEDADESGFFWVVPEIKLLENSAVLFGCNQLTPTLNAKTDTEDQPPSGTDKQPLKKSFDIGTIIKNI